jgi:hypothetical protein
MWAEPGPRHDKPHIWRIRGQWLVKRGIGNTKTFWTVKDRNTKAIRWVQTTLNNQATP